MKLGYKNKCQILDLFCSSICKPLLTDLIPFIIDISDKYDKKHYIWNRTRLNSLPIGKLEELYKRLNYSEKVYNERLFQEKKRG